MKAEALAKDMLTIIPGKLPVPLYEILRTMDIDLEVFELPRSISGVFNEVEGQPIIGINSRHPSTRRRFTVAHELFHFLTYEDDEISAMTATEAGVEEVEKSANRFAALLLMPEDAVRQLWNRGICSRHMAETFGVSEQALQIRLRDLGLDPMDAYRSQNRHQEDCCEMASVQRLARTPYIEELLGSWNGSCAVMEDPQPYLPIFE